MCFVLLAWFARAALLAGIAKTNSQSMQRVQNTWSFGTGLFKCSDTNLVFQTVIFLILVVRNNNDGQRPSEIVYITVILSYVSASNCSLNRLNLCLLFLR